MRLFGLLIVAAMLAGCQTVSDRRAATLKGACDSFVAPRDVVLGKRRTDQRWIDGTIESGVSACGWARPRAPASS
jgi:hypothetical protein